LKYLNENETPHEETSLYLNVAPLAAIFVSARGIKKQSLRAISFRPIDEEIGAIQCARRKQEIKFL